MRLAADIWVTTQMIDDFEPIMQSAQVETTESYDYDVFVRLGGGQLIFT